MIDSRQKGRTAETNAKKELIKLTGLGWERVPMSGALDPKHKLKGDLYVPDTQINFCVEVKHYADDHITSKLLTSVNPQFLQWWEQTKREAKQIDRDPLLIFKYNRSKWFCAFNDWDVALTLQDGEHRIITYNSGTEDIYICLLSDFCDVASFV